MKIFSSKSGCCFLDMLEKLQIRVCRIDILTLAASLELLDHHGNVGGLIFSTSIILVDIPLNWLNWFHFYFLVGGPLVILIGCMVFRSAFQDVMRMSVSTVSFLLQLQHSGIPCLQNIKI